MDHSKIFLLPFIIIKKAKVFFNRVLETCNLKTTPEDYSNVLADINRPKSRLELVILSGAVCGIEFCYAAETAFVTPTLLQLGVRINYMTTIWCISPLIGFFLTPILGSISDCCRSQIGRRRPFIIILSLGIIAGLVLIPNGSSIAGMICWDRDSSHDWSVLITILGAVLLDFCCDACQSPSRAYLLDVTNSDDHATGLSTFTIMAGVGGSFGYLLGGIQWESVSFLHLLIGSDERIVFMGVLVLFVVCTTLTITSFKEIPLDIMSRREAEEYSRTGDNLEMSAIRFDKHCLPDNLEDNFPDNSGALTVYDYLRSVINMPRALRLLCLTNLFSWMSLVCYSLYFTDFVGEVVFEGQPKSSEDSPEHQQYRAGVRFGCFAMALYSMSCAVYSFYFKNLSTYLGYKTMYVGGGVAYSAGMLILAMFPTKPCAIIFSTCAGIQYSTLFTMPYLLISKYHNYQTLLDDYNHPRGIGTDVAVVGSMVFLAQFILSLFIGQLIDWIGTNAVSVYVASLLSACSAFSASRVVYVNDL